MLQDLWEALGDHSDIVIALIATVGLYLTARPALADIGLKGRLDTAQRFIELVGQANKGSEVGVLGQVASIWLIASFGRDERHLREPARETLRSMNSAFSDRRITDAARDAQKMLPSKKRPW